MVETYIYSTVCHISEQENETINEQDLVMPRGHGGRKFGENPHIFIHNIQPEFQ